MSGSSASVEGEPASHLTMNSRVSSLAHPAVTSAVNPVTTLGGGLADHPQAVRLRVLSYNMHDLLDDREALARVLRACQADVVCAQEAPRRLVTWRRLRQAHRLARRAGLDLVCGGRGSGGAAVLVAPDVEVVAAQAVRLPVRPWWRRSRGYATATVRVPGGPVVRVVSVHLGLTARERADHVHRIVAWLRGQAESALVVAGDLNESPDGPSWRAFGPLLRDAVQDVAGADMGATAPTFPAGGPRRRIDGVLVSQQVQVDSVRAGAAILGVRADDLRQASDHLPVSADLRLAPRTTPTVPA
ncbi:MAG: endonuclease/exonuclease/phosphatase family protein [Angustibacter sp.]